MDRVDVELNAHQDAIAEAERKQPAALAIRIEQIKKGFTKQDIIDALSEDDHFLEYMLTAIQQGTVDKEYTGELTHRAVNAFVELCAESDLS